MSKSLFLCGSSGVGKTTQSLILSGALGLPIVDGISRSSPFLMGTSEHQQHVSRRVFKKCMTQKAIHCRTPIDVFAYSQVNQVNSPMDKQHIEFFAKTNPVVVYFPMLDVIEDDGVRPTSREFNEKIDECIRGDLERYNITHLVLPVSDNPGERSLEIIKYWRNYDSQELLGQP